jgi:hypothetical protein
MKRDKVIYWVVTGLLSAGMLMSAFMYLSKNPELMKSFQNAGYPEYFVTILGTAKLLGAIVLLLPVWSKLKEWAYAGFAFTFIGAIWTHLATSTLWVAPFIALGVLLVSYWFRMRAKLV